MVTKIAGFIVVASLVFTLVYALVGLVQIAPWWMILWFVVFIAAAATVIVSVERS